MQGSHSAISNKPRLHTKSPYSFNENPENLCYEQKHISVLIWIATIIEYWFNYRSSSKCSSAAQTILRDTSSRIFFLNGGSFDLVESVDISFLNTYVNERFVQWRWSETMTKRIVVWCQGSKKIAFCDTTYCLNKLTTYERRVAAASLLIGSRWGDFEKRALTIFRLEADPYESAHQLNCSLLLPSQQWQTESNALRPIPCYQIQQTTNFSGDWSSNTVSETQQKQTKSILPAQLTMQENFTPIAERATDS